MRMILDNAKLTVTYAGVLGDIAIAVRENFCITISCAMFQMFTKLDNLIFEFGISLTYIKFKKLTCIFVLSKDIDFPVDWKC